jgi:stage IV sporulation protein FB
MSLSKPLISVAVQISPWAAITALVLLAWADSLFGSRCAIAATTLLIASLLIHEIGHIVAASLTRVRVSAIGISAAGTYIRRQRAGSPWAESMISLAGPMVSLALGGLFLFLGDGDLCTWLAKMNLIVAISNLIPIAGTDGDRALSAICIGFRAI